MFKDWRICDQSLVPMEFHPEYVYYVHARAWHFKGYIGGRHSYLTWFSKEHNQQLVIEYTDRETLEVQGADIIYSGTDHYTNHAPFISNRKPNARWFGADPYIKGSCSLYPHTYSDFVDACDIYPNRNTEFNILHNNCNTFTSYLLYKMMLEIEQPFPAVGHRSRQRWSNSGA
jgi:hypothetical protein